MRKRIQISFISTTLSLLFLLFVSNIDAQITVVNDGILTIKEGQLVHINGNLSNYSAFFLNKGDFRLTGNLLNEVSVANPGTGIFRFIGFEEQKLTLLDTMSMFNIELDNSAGLTFDGVNHLQVFGNMNFWDGITNTSENTMLFFQENATHNNSDLFSHINGPALKRGTSDFEFPLGKEGHYRPAAISDFSDLSTYQMEYFHSTYFEDLKEPRIKKVNEEGYWDIQRTNGSAFPKLTLNYDQSSNMFSNLENVDIIRWNDLWKVEPSISDGAAPAMGLTTLGHIPHFGLYTTAEIENNKLKIDDTNIAQGEDCTIRIDWVVPAGNLVDRYVIEFSYDSLNFEYAGEVPGDPEYLPRYETYFFIDQYLHGAPKIYYRIKMIAPGLPVYFKYSEILTIDNNCIFDDCILFPNPVSSNNNINLQMYSESETQMPIQIWDVVGRLMFEQTLDLKTGPQIYEINTKDARLASGTYFLQINPKKTLKFIVIYD